MSQARAAEGAYVSSFAPAPFSHKPRIGDLCPRLPASKDAASDVICAMTGRFDGSTTRCSAFVSAQRAWYRGKAS